MTPLWIRILVGITLFAGFGISGYHRRKAAAADASAQRREEPGMLIALRLIVALPTFGVLLGALFAPAAVAPASFDAPTALRLFGAGAAMLGVPLAVSLFCHLGSNVTATTLTKQSHELVTSGPYRWVRHPLYLTGMLLFSGAGLALGNWVLLLFVAVFLVAWTFVVIPREEAELEKRFGEEYRNYRARTGALLPCFGR